MEFSAVRNCLVHRKGIVDKPFLAACGTTKLALGEEILLTSQQAERYKRAAMYYAAVAWERVRGRYAPKAETTADAAFWLEELEELLKS